MDMRRYALALLFGMTAMLSSCGTMQSSHRSPTEPKAIAHIRFYDKDWAAGHNFCTVAINSLPYVYSGGFFGCTKDEARSAKLQDLPAGTRIVLYDDPDCGDSDDYAIITVLKYAHEIVVGGFKYPLKTKIGGRCGFTTRTVSWVRCPARKWMPRGRIRCMSRSPSVSRRQNSVSGTEAPHDAWTPLAG